MPHCHNNSKYQKIIERGKVDTLIGKLIQSCMRNPHVVNLQYKRSKSVIIENALILIITF